jgi:hypothetical protein
LRISTALRMKDLSWMAPNGQAAGAGSAAGALLLVDDGDSVFVIGNSTGRADSLAGTLVVRNSLIRAGTGTHTAVDALRLVDMRLMVDRIEGDGILVAGTGAAVC